MEALDDLLSDPDCEGAARILRPSFADIRWHSGTLREEDEEDFDDLGYEDVDASLLKAQADRLSRPLIEEPGYSSDEAPGADYEDEEGLVLQDPADDLLDGVAEDALSSGRRGLSEDELCAHSALVGPSARGLSASPGPPLSPADKELSPAKVESPGESLDDPPIATSGSYKAPPPSGVSEASTALPDDAAAAGAPARRPFLKKGSRAKSTLPGNPGPLATRPPAPKREPRKSLKLHPSGRSADSVDALDKFDSTWGAAVDLPPEPGAVARRAPSFSVAEASETLREEPASGYGEKKAQGDQDWADSVPWDCRDLALDLDFEDDLGLEEIEGEPPTSNVVRSYFHSPATSAPSSAARRATPPTRSAHWEGADAFSALYGRQAATAGDGTLSSAAAASRRRAGEGGRKSSKSSEPPSATSAEQETLAEEARARLAALDEELKKYEKENETLKKLQAQAKAAERDITREREKLWKEVEAERTALHAEFDVERAAMRKERRRLAEAADRQRQQQREERGAAEERQRLVEKSEQLEEEMKEKEKRWQRTVDRLQRQVTDFTRKNSELQEEVKRLNTQAAQAHQSSWLKEVAAAKRGLSAGAKGRRSLPGGLGSSNSTSSVKDAGPGREREMEVEKVPSTSATLRGVENGTRRPSVGPKPSAAVGEALKNKFYDRFFEEGTF